MPIYTLGNTPAAAPPVFDPRANQLPEQTLSQRWASWKNSPSPIIWGVLLCTGLLSITAYKFLKAKA